MKIQSKTTLFRLFLGIALIIGLSIWIYYPATQNGFVWDTKGYLFPNEFWVAKLTPYHIVWMLSSLEMSNWHPLTWFSWAVDYKLYDGLSTWGFHLTSIVLHSLNSALVFVCTLVIFGLNNPQLKSIAGLPMRTDYRALLAAFLSAMIYAAHPQHVESVAWVAERKDLLCQLFLLLSMLSYVIYVTGAGELKSKWYKGTIILFALAVMSKPMAVSFPLVLLLVDVYPLRRTSLCPSSLEAIRSETYKSLFIEKIPFFLLSALLAILTVYAQQAALSSMSLDLRLLNAFNSIILYINKFLLPIDLSPQYPYFVALGEQITWKKLVPAIGVIALSIVSLVAVLKGKRWWLIAWLFYLITLAPVLGLMQVGLQGAADRYTYFPTLPFYFLIAGGIFFVLEKKMLLPKILTVASVFAVVFVLSGKTREQIPVWKNTQNLWEHVLKIYPDNFIANLNLGIFHLNQSNYDKATAHFLSAERQEALPSDTLAWLSVTYLLSGQNQLAMDSLIRLGVTAESSPVIAVNESCIQYNLGWIYAQQGMLAESAELFGRVGGHSKMEENAKIWLERLEHAKQSPDSMPIASAAPTFCKALVPSMKSSD